MKKIKRLLVLALALSMIMGAIPVYAVEDVPEVTDIGEEPQADNGGQPEVWSEPGTGGTASEPEADETAAGAKAGEASPALEAARDSFGAGNGRDRGRTSGTGRYRKY